MKNASQQQGRRLLVNLITPALIALLFFIPLRSQNRAQAGQTEALQPITVLNFIQHIPPRDNIVLNAGELGEYRFSEDANPYELPAVKIRPELVNLLNKLQDEFNTPMIITSGYRTQVHNRYLWAKWLSENPKHIQKNQQ